MDKVMTKMSQGQVGEEEVNRLAAKHAQAMQGRERVWKSEIAKHKQELRRDYQEYVEQLWKAEQTAPEESPSRRFVRVDSSADDSMSTPSRKSSNGNVDDGSIASRGSGMLKRGLGLLRRSALASTDAKSPGSSAAATLYRALSPSSTSPDPGTPLEESFTVRACRIGRDWG